MAQIIYDTTNVIDWEQSPQNIIEQFKSKQDPGLVTFFHGHIILFQDMTITEESPQKFSESVDFHIVDSKIRIPSHGLEISKYLVDVRSDEFQKIPLDVFIKFFPECSDLKFTSTRKSLSWKQICQFESRIYNSAILSQIRNYINGNQNDLVKPHFVEVKSPIIYENTKNKIVKSLDYSDYDNLGQYTKNIFLRSKLFCKYLADSLPKNARVLDLGGSDEPWFSYLCAENDMHVFTYDMLKPSDPELIQKKGITYICNDINNIGNHKNLLHDLDFIFCRNLSPPQRFWDWYDPDFVKIWKTLIDMINENGIIYWEQMTNGTGIPDTFFMNHDAKYFKEFFEKLGLHVNITKYGYMRFKLAKSSNAFVFPWNSHIIGKNSLFNSSEHVQDLLGNGDYASLIKHYAMQIQSFFEKNDFEKSHTIEITGDPISVKILKILLLDNFFYDAVKINESIKDPSIKLADQNTERFMLKPKGFLHDEYFLIDEDEDIRFTDGFLKMLERFPLYDLHKKHPKLLNIKKKYFNRIKFWS